MPDAMPPEMPSAPATPETPGPRKKPKKAKAEAAPSNDKIAKDFGSRIDSARRKRKTFMRVWKANVERRVGKNARLYTQGLPISDDIDQSELNPDWALTKVKIANLYSQTPEVRGTHEAKKYAVAIPPFMKQLNYEIGDKRGKIGVAIGEELADVVNAAGVGAILVDYIARYEDVEEPVTDPAKLPPGMAQSLQKLVLDDDQLRALNPATDIPQLLQQGIMPYARVPKTVSDLIQFTRISPSDLLWPSEFTGSDLDDADWVGYEGTYTEAEAMVELELSERDVARLGGDDKKEDDSLRVRADRDGKLKLPKIKYDRIFYKRHKVDAEEKHFECIWELVFVQGQDKPAIHRPWPGQKYVEELRTYVGNRRFPLQFLTTTYISDNPIPPSNTEAGRPQVDDLRRSRSHIFKARAWSKPMRWMDTTRVDALVQEQIRRGDFDEIIPTMGQGDKSIGEITRASYPSEDFAFDRETKADLTESWSLGGNQMGAMGGAPKTKAEVVTVQQNHATIIGQEREAVAKHFLRLCELAAGYMVLHSDFKILSDEERQQMRQVWDMGKVLHDLVLRIRPDSTIMLDAAQRLDRATKYFNLMFKTGFLQPLPVIAEITELAGFDPAECVMQPQPKGPDPANLSYRFSGKDDLMSPIVAALLMKANQFPSPAELLAAVTALEDAKNPAALQQKVQQQQMQQMQQKAGGRPGMPGAPGMPQKPSVPRTMHQEASLPDKIMKRERDGR